MLNNLVISTLGKDRPGIVQQLSQTILDQACNILDSRMTRLGGEFASIMWIEGEADRLAQLEQQLDELAEKLDLTLHTRQTARSEQAPVHRPYRIEVVSLDNPGIVQQLSSFLSRRQINIRDMATHRYAAAMSGTPMFAVQMHVDVPADASVKEFREDFINLCDSLNLDAHIEAETI